jgi:hypothetical protein
MRLVVSNCARLPERSTASIRRRPEASFSTVRWWVDSSVASVTPGTISSRVPSYWSRFGDFPEDEDFVGRGLVDRAALGDQAGGPTAPRGLRRYRVGGRHSGSLPSCLARWANLVRWASGDAGRKRRVRAHVTREKHDPDDLRRVVLPLREVELGTATVTELKRVRFPAARTTLLQPWAVVETVTL